MPIADNHIYIDELLIDAVNKNASDIHLTVGVPPLYRINGNLVFTKQNKIDAVEIKKIFERLTTNEQQKKFKNNGDVDFSYSIYGFGQFRGNAFLQQGKIAIALRLLAAKIPNLDDLGYPKILKDLALKPRGLVVVTGPTGAGKSTTIAAMIDLINQTQARHIITLEDPIEYVHIHSKSIINQREIYKDTKSFSDALRAALREDPDVILIGEMRDKETISAAINAALTGHLVFATLHTFDSAQTIERIINVFEPHQQQQIKLQLSMVLQGIIAQQLLKLKNLNGRIAALEIMIATPAIRNLIREGKTHQIVSCIQTGAKFGMQTMDMALKNLLNKNLISCEDAALYAVGQDYF